MNFLDNLAEEVYGNYVGALQNETLKSTLYFMLSNKFVEMFDNEDPNIMKVSMSGFTYINRAFISALNTKMAIYLARDAALLTQIFPMAQHVKSLITFSVYCATQDNFLSEVNKL